MTIAGFKSKIWAHYRLAGRGDMPWRHTRDPYAILVSEAMLQQTQVPRVREYYKKFLKKFPDFRTLARAKTRDVLTVWQGLGYNRRALFLKRAAEIVVLRHGGRLPRDREALCSLPGIGKGTSGSLMAFAFNEPVVFIETNIRRVYIHFFFKGKKKVTDDDLERYIERTVDGKRAREWYWALMDYGAAMTAGRSAAKGATPKKKKTERNPNRRSAHYKRQAAFAGSDRELRGKIVRSTLAAKSNKMDVAALFKVLAVPRQRFEKILDGLQKERFIVRKGNFICIKE